MIQCRQILRILSCILTFLGTRSLLAQGRQSVEATVSFSFWVDGSELLAGRYQIEHIDSSTYFLLRSKDGKGVHNVYTRPLDEDPIKEQNAKLIFRIENGKYYLYGGSRPFGARRDVRIFAASSVWRFQGRSAYRLPLGPLPACFESFAVMSTFSTQPNVDASKSRHLRSIYS